MRHLVLLVLAGVMASAQAQRTAIVVGAGVSGLKAALDLATAGYTVTVLEARNRVGGRVWTNATPQGPIEMGAQWIHGKSPNPVYSLAVAQGWPLVASNDDDSLIFEAVTGAPPKAISTAQEKTWENVFARLETEVAKAQNTASNSANLAGAISAFSAALSPRDKVGLDLMVESNYVQEYAASPSKMSLNWFDDDSTPQNGDSIIKAGYNTLVNYLQSELTKLGSRVTFKLNTVVTQVAYSAATRVTITTSAGAFNAKLAVLTLPIGVLEQNKVAFRPALPAAKTSAISKLGMGTLNKVILAYPDISAVPATHWIERIPLAADAGRWREFFSLRTPTAQPVVVAFNAGDPALYPASLTDATLVSQAAAALKGMYPSLPAAPIASWVTRWHEDPYSYGSYSYVRAGAKGNERSNLAAPINKMLYWAGEATSSKWPSTVQGAYQSGADAAQKALADNP